MLVAPHFANHFADGWHPGSSVCSRDWTQISCTRERTFVEAADDLTSCAMDHVMIIENGINGWFKPEISTRNCPFFRLVQVLSKYLLAFVVGQNCHQRNPVRCIRCPCSNPVSWQGVSLLYYSQILFVCFGVNTGGSICANCGRVAKDGQRDTMHNS